MLEILYRDEYLIAINKPHGLLVHPSAIARDAQEFALHRLRDQIGRKVFPAHRLDRKTGGVLLFSLTKEADRRMQPLFAEREVVKKYRAIVRGFTSDEGIIDYPLKRENGTLQEAVTSYRTLQRREMDIALGQHATSRYSFIEAIPQTGRMHQLRKHFAHIFHPIIGDRPYGCNKQNRFWLQTFGMNTMLLHASELLFNHPFTGHQVQITAGLQEEFRRVCQIAGFES